MTLNQELLGKHVKVVGGFAFKSEQFAEKGIPVIRISDIQGGIVSIEKAAQIPEANIGKGESYCIQAGDILVAMSGATTGKIGLVPNNFDGLVLQNQRVGNFKITSPEKLHKGYLKHYVNSPFYQGKILNTMAGAAQPNISSKQLENIEIPLPPLPDQIRIATILDQADALRVKRREALAQLDSLTQSIFIEMFGDLSNNPMKFPVHSLGSICDVRDGTHDSPKFVESGFPLITTKNLRDGTVDFSDASFISAADYDAINKRSKVDMGDILMPMIGTIGNPVLVENEPAFAIKNVALIKFSSNSPDRRFILRLLKSRYFERLVMSKNKGGTQKFLSLGDIRSLPIPLPPKPLQEKFSRTMKQLKLVETTHSDSSAELDNLFASLQYRAFRGELV
ncbi:MAG: restriction endonuclease subunit S [Gallionellaceae bacterium]